ncbi:putative S-adenosylmethionine-dependent methyltransferase [Morchella snyderi]|nr:putative S-adenosylmethionine-dependent methyltransferase [Morchella snyderi]
MAAFAKKNFGYAAYATHRPTYPTTLFTAHLLPYHQGPTHTLLDLGCGPGTVTRPLGTHFTRAIGVDPSAGMLESARALTPPATYPHIEYRLSDAEALPFLPDASVDMVVAGQAAHWFDVPRFWAEMARVVRPGGTVAAWTYKDFVFPGFPAASLAVARYTYGRDKMGPCWQQPGRTRCQSRMRFLEPPPAEWAGVERWEYEPKVEGNVEDLEALGYANEVDETEGLVRRGEPLLLMRWKLGEVENYARTWSAAHEWGVRNAGGDIIGDMFADIRKAAGWEGEGWRERVVDVEFGHGVLCARRK